MTRDRHATRPGSARPDRVRWWLALAAAVLLAAGAGAQEPYGAATAAGNGRAPRLSSNQAWIGSPGFALSIANATGGATVHVAIASRPASFAFASTSVNVSFAPNELLIVDAFQLGGPVGAAGGGFGQWLFPATLPPDPMFAGLMVFAQAFIQEPGAPLPQAATAGVRVELTLPPAVFIGTAMGGPGDPFAVIDPFGGTVVHAGVTELTNNVADVAFANGGLDLFAALGSTEGISFADFRHEEPLWSVLHPGVGPCTGVEHDWQRHLLFAVAGGSPATRELIALDAAFGTSGFGQIAGATSGLSANGLIAGWALSRSGRTAAVPVSTSAGTVLILVDTDAASVTWMHPVATLPVPGGTAATAVAFTANDEYLLVALAGFGAQELARLHLASQTWTDFDPSTAAQENLALPGFPSRMAASADGGFAVFCGNGWVRRVDFGGPLVAAWSPPFGGTPGQLLYASGISLSRDDSMLAVACAGPSRLLILDAASGATLNTIPLNGFSNVSVTRWR